jgi:hypothetical protein
MKPFFRLNCKTNDDIIALLSSRKSQLQIDCISEPLMEYQKYHRYIREHNIKGVAVHKKGDIIYLSKV